MASWNETYARFRVDSPQPFAPPPSFGRYRILERIGRGGMGEVFLARDDALDRRVALKVPTIEAGDDAAFLRFQREARLAASLRHPNFCPVFDVGMASGRPFMAMAYIEGAPLGVVDADGRPRPPREAAALVAKLAGAMAEAHDVGILHRDLKPGNIMIDRRGEPIIMDFGISRRWGAAEEQPLTVSGALMGTVAYMSPEQVEGDHAALGPHSDVYSLGVIFYELLSGARPFQGGQTKVLAQILIAEPPPPSSHRPDLPAEAERICLKAMAKAIPQRYPGMREFAADLDAFTRGAVATRVAVAVPPRRGDADPKTRPVAEPAIATPKAAKTTARAETPAPPTPPAPVASGPRLASVRSGRGLRPVHFVGIATAAAVIGGAVYLAGSLPLRMEEIPPEPLPTVTNPVATTSSAEPTPSLEPAPPTVAAVDEPKPVAPPIEPAPKPLEAASPEVEKAAEPALLAMAPSTGGAASPEPASTPKIIRESRRIGPVMGVIERFAASRDGTRLLTLASDGSACCWELPSGTLLWTRGDANSHVRSIAISADGRRAALGFDQGELQVVDRVSGTVTLDARPNSSASLAFSEDGDALLSGEGEIVKLWDVGSRAVARDFKAGAGVKRVQLSADKRRAFAVMDLSAVMWDVESSRPIWTGKAEMELANYDGMMTRDGSRIVTEETCWMAGEHAFARRFLRVALWDPNASRMVGGSLDGYEFEISGDGRRILLAPSKFTDDHKVIDAQTGSETARLTAADHPRTRGASAISQHGDTVLIPGRDGPELWDPASGEVESFGDESLSLSGAFVSDRFVIFTSHTHDRIVYVWDRSTKRRIELRGGHPTRMRGAVLSDNRDVIFSYDTGICKYYGINISGGDPLVIGNYENMDKDPVYTSINLLFFAHGGQRILWEKDGKLDIDNSFTFDSSRGGPKLDGAKAVSLWPDARSVLYRQDSWDSRRVVRIDVASMKAVWTHALDDAPFDVALASSGEAVVVAGRNGRLERLDGDTGAVTASIDGEGGSLTKLVPSDDGRRVLALRGHEAGRFGDSIELWDFDTRSRRWTAGGATDELLSGELDSNARRAVLKGADGSIRVWDAEAGRELWRTPERKPISWHVLSSDGRRVLTAAEGEREVRIQDADDGSEVGRLLGHDGAITGLSLTRDGLAAATASLDGTLRVWDLPPVDR